MANVIVVDDDYNNVSLTKMILEMDGFTVIACTETREAQAAITADVSALFIDVNLERGQSGLTLLHEIRDGETAASPNTPVIMTSGDARREKDCLQAGADKFLLKPFSPNRLSELLDNLLTTGG